MNSLKKRPAAVCRAFFVGVLITIIYSSVWLSPALNPAAGVFISCLSSRFEQGLPTSLINSTGAPAEGSGGKRISFMGGYNALTVWRQNI
jgi:hypothetical protein